MKLCKYSVYGSNCPNLLTCKQDHVDVKTLVQSDLELQQKGNVWPLSGFGPFSYKSSLPDYIEDQSFEEIRSMYYDKTMTFFQSAQKFHKAIKNAESKIKTLMSMNNEVINKLVFIYDEPPKHFTTSFDANYANTQNSISNSMKSTFVPTKSFFGTTSKEQQPVNNQQKQLQATGIKFGLYPQEKDRIKKKMNNSFGCTLQQQEPENLDLQQNQQTSNGVRLNFTLKEQTPEKLNTQQKKQKDYGFNLGFPLPMKKEQNTGSAFDFPRQQQEVEKVDTQQQDPTRFTFCFTPKKHDINPGMQQESEKKETPNTQQKDTGITFSFIQKEQVAKLVDTEQKQQQDTGFTFGSPLQELVKINALVNQTQGPFGLLQKELEQKQQDTVLASGGKLQKPSMQDGILNTSKLGQQIVGTPMANLDTLQNQPQGPKVTSGFLQIKQNQQQHQDTLLVFGKKPQEPEKQDGVLGASKLQQNIFGTPMPNLGSLQNQLQGPTATFGSSQKKPEQQLQHSALAFGGQQQNPEKQDGILGASKLQQNSFGTPMPHIGSLQNQPQGPTVTLGFTQKKPEQQLQGSVPAFGGQQQKPDIQGAPKLFGAPMLQHIPNQLFVGTSNPQYSFAPEQTLGVPDTQKLHQEEPLGVFSATQPPVADQQCNVCKQHLQEISAKLDEFLTIVKDNKFKFEEQKNEIDCLSDLFKSWSTIGDRPAYVPNCIENKWFVHPLIIKPKCKQDSEATKNYMKTKVDPTDLSAQIDGVSMGEDGSVTINCKDEYSAKKLESQLNAKCGQSYDISVVDLKNPQVIVTGIDDQIDDKLLIKIIQQQNNIEGELELIKRLQPTDNASEYSALIKVDKDLYKQLLKGMYPYFNIGWNKCLVNKSIEMEKERQDTRRVFVDKDEERVADNANTVSFEKEH